MGLVFGGTGRWVFRGLEIAMHFDGGLRRRAAEGLGG